jgi:hypothetical protein
MQSHQIETLKAEVKDVLENNILRFWLQMRDAEHGGFYGQMTGNGRLMKQADKGAILNARIRRVWYGARDEAMGACGGVTNLFMESFPNRPALVGGILAESCREVLSAFFAGLREKRES